MRGAVRSGNIVATMRAIPVTIRSIGNSKGIEPIAILAHGPMFLLSHKPIRAAADFKGQKIRVPGAAPLQIEPFKKLGANPVSMPLGEVLSAMQNRKLGFCRTVVR